MRVLSWNVKGIKSIGQKRLDAVIAAIASAEPDIVALQEVSVEQAATFRARLHELGLTSFFTTATSDVKHKQYGNVIASRWKR